MGGKTETKVDFPAPTPEERALTANQLDISKAQLAALLQQTEFQNKAFEAYGPLIQTQADLLKAQYGDLSTPEAQALAARQSELQRQQLEYQIANLPVQQELLDMQLDDLRRGGAASPQQLELIKQASDAALAAGESDIAAFQEEATARLRDELAGALGLRPTDTPIVDRGALIAKEAVRQQGNLASNLREAQATAQLNFPLAAQQLQAGIGLSQQQMSQAASEFQAQLRQAATSNRLALASGLGGQLSNVASGGLGLSSIGPNPGLTPFGRQQSYTQTQRTPFFSGLGLADALGGLGGLGMGLGALFAR